MVDGDVAGIGGSGAVDGIAVAETDRGGLSGGLWGAALEDGWVKVTPVAVRGIDGDRSPVCIGAGVNCVLETLVVAA